MKSLRYNIIHPFFGESNFLYRFTSLDIEGDIKRYYSEETNTSRYRHKSLGSELFTICSKEYNII